MRKNIISLTMSLVVVFSVDSGKRKRKKTRSDNKATRNKAEFRFGFEYNLVQKYYCLGYCVLDK